MVSCACHAEHALLQSTHKLNYDQQPHASPTSASHSLNMS